MTARLDWARVTWPLLTGLAAATFGVLAGLDPRLAIGVAFAAGFVAIAFTDLAAGLALFAFVGFIELTPSESPFVSATKLAGLLLALSWFAVVTTRHRGRIDFMAEHPYASVALGLFLGWAALSMAWSEDPAIALGSVGRWALNAVLLLVTFTAVRNSSDAGRVILAFMLGAAAAAVFGLASPSEETGGRLGAGPLDPNYLAAVLVSGAALAVGVIALYRNNPPVRVLAAGAGFFCLFAVWLTASRGGLIALGASLVFALLIAGRWRAQATLIVALFAACSYVYFAEFAPVEVQERIAEPTQGQARVQEGRTTIWQVAWRAFEANPAQGVGTGNFEVSSKHYLFQPGALPRSEEIIDSAQVAHNTYLEVLAELGVVGFALLCGLLGFSMGSVLAAASNFARVGDQRLRVVSLCVAVALFGNLSAGFFVSAQYSKQLWLLIALGPALLSISRATGEARRSD